MLNVKRISQQIVGVLGVGLIVINPFSASTALAGDLKISGQVFNDSNGNGSLDTSENGLSNFRVYLDANTNGSFEASELSVVTDGTGNFEFSNLEIGQYQLREVQQQGWIQTLPTYAQNFVYIVDLSQSDQTGFLIGNQSISGSGDGSGSGSGQGSGSGSGGTGGSGGNGGGTDTGGGGNGDTGGSGGDNTNPGGGTDTGGDNGAPGGDIGDEDNEGGTDVGGGDDGQVLGEQDEVDYGLGEGNDQLPRTGLPASLIMATVVLLLSVSVSLKYLYSKAK